MNIDPKAKIAGIPSLKIRELMRMQHYGMGWSASVDQASGLLEISHDATLIVLEELRSLGYIVFVDDAYNWKTTIAGNALANASATKPIRRPKADQAFAQFMERVNQVNQNPYYLYKVVKVVLFGSYITDTEAVNDVDVAIELSPKEADSERHWALVEQRIEEREKPFSNYSERFCWPEIEVTKFLRARSHVISLHDVGEVSKIGATYKTIYSEEERSG